MTIDARPIRVEHARAHRKYNPLSAFVLNKILWLTSYTLLSSKHPASKLRGNITKEAPH
jgi:hypothetical protein